MLPSPEPLILEQTATTPFLYPRSKSYPLTESWENGGVALSDPSEELTKYVWKAWTDGNAIYCKRDDLDTIHTLFYAPNITEIDLTFDQNMRPCFAFVSNGIAKLYWYNTLIANYDVTDFVGVKNPRVSLDDKRRFNVANSDIILAYIKDNQLCYRQQRDRFGIEYVLKTYQVNHQKLLWRIGMGTKNRFLFYVR